MTGTVGALIGATAGLGALLLILGFKRSEPTDAHLMLSQRRRLSLRRMRRAVSTEPTNPKRLRVYLVIVAALAGALVWLLSGWIIAVLAAPIAALVLPVVLAGLLGKSPQAGVIERLEAMEEWTRNLAGVLGVGGAGLEAAITASRASCPKALHPHVALLVARLAARTPTDLALRQFADDIDDATGDLIASALILAAQRRGEDVVKVLENLAETVSDEVRMRRDIEADRAKPRTTARLVTLLTLAALLYLFASGTYLAPYKDGVGQVILLALLSAYVCCLLWMQRLARVRPSPRFLSADHAVGLRPDGGTSRVDRPALAVRAGAR